MAKKGKKAAKAAKKGGPRGPRIDTEAKITIKAKENPYKAGSKAHDTFELMSKCDTVGEFVKKAEANDKKYRNPRSALRRAKRGGFANIG